MFGLRPRQSQSPFHFTATSLCRYKVNRFEGRFFLRFDNSCVLILFGPFVSSCFTVVYRLVRRRHGAPISSLLLSPSIVSSLEMHRSGQVHVSPFKIMLVNLGVIATLHSMGGNSFHILAPLEKLDSWPSRKTSLGHESRIAKFSQTAGRDTDLAGWLFRCSSQRVASQPAYEFYFYFRRKEKIAQGSVCLSVCPILSSSLPFLSSFRPSVVHVCRFHFFKLFRRSGEIFAIAFLSESLACRTSMPRRPPSRP